MSDNIQVVVRCRGRNDREIAAKSQSIVELPNDNFSIDEPYVTVNNDSSGAYSSKTSTGKVFRVDQVYGPSSEQSLFFENVALPLFRDFVSGLNVTILAYGQTGSGKTYSMCGDLQGEHSGIIPRVLTKLFSVLDGDYMVKLSCVELYKEELSDLINDELGLTKSKLRLVSESRDSPLTVIQNLTEVHIDSCEMGFKILKKCLTKRKTSATKLNDLSSRSHTIFTIYLYRKVESAGVLEYRVSKMNLVDLAGSEDINKSGAINERAREAGSINQSLLTLGKVINSLSEGKEPKHIPYRESKLTRLLQGSIGGKTKTALIATISPAKINAHETISTLNYASKAKNIKNVPQSTHDSDMILKRVLVQELSSLIARVTRDLMASKDKDGGIKMSLQNYEEYNSNMADLQLTVKEKTTEAVNLSNKLDARNVEILLLLRKIKEMEENNANIMKDFENKNSQVSKLNDDLLKLQDKYINQKEQVSKVVHNNIQDVTGVLSRIVDSLKSDNSRVGNGLEDLTSTIATQLTSIQTVLRTKVSEVTEVLNQDALSIQEILKRNVELSKLYLGIRGFDIHGELSKLQEARQSFTLYMESQHLRPDSETNKTILKDANKKLLEDSNVMKLELLSRVSRAVDDIFLNGQAAYEKSLGYAALCILLQNNEALRQHNVALAKDTEEAVSGAKLKIQRLEEASSVFEKEMQSNIEKSSKVIAENSNQTVDKALGEITHAGASQTNSVIQQVNRKIDTIALFVEKTSTTTSQNLQQATSDLGRFHAVLTELEESPAAKRAYPTSPHRSPLQPMRLNSPEAKRRKQPPLKGETGLHKSKIPHLFPATGRL